MTDYENKIAQLGQRAVDLTETIAEAKAKRAALAPKVVDGDRNAIKQLEQIDATAAILQREIELMTLAVDQLKAQAADEAVEQAEQYRRQREADARSAAEAILTLDAEIDEGMIKLRKLFERRIETIRSLAATNVVDGYITLRMQQRFPGSSAACAHGLKDFLALELVPIQHVRALADADEFLRRPLRARLTSDPPPDEAA